MMDIEQYKFLEDIGYNVYQLRISDHRDWSITDIIYACKKEIADSQKTGIDVFHNSVILEYWDSKNAIFKCMAGQNVRFFTLP